ncbi:response regulator transcription factor [Streptomyces sp. Da 82-17]|uniref:response regulator transcription factor n=1 Tax=Streptomyces sp. Da 82-17 TaxID=3377116 RepID=UPI0038D394CD
MTAPVQPAPATNWPVTAAHPVRAYPRTLAVEPRTFLTAREKATLILAANGNTNRAIGKAMGIGEETVKTRMQAILRKLRVNDRAQAVAVALRLELIDLDDVVVPHGANAGYLTTD